MPDNQPDIPAPTQFAASASTSLAPVSRDLEAVRSQAEEGGLRLDEGSAHRLLAALADIQQRVHRLVLRGTELDVELQLGDNLVGRAMSQRLRGAASGGTSAAIPVLEEFDKALQDVESTVRRAAGMYTAAEDDARRRLLAGETLDGATDGGL